MMETGFPVSFRFTRFSRCFQGPGGHQHLGSCCYGLVRPILRWIFACWFNEISHHFFFERGISICDCSWVFFHGIWWWFTPGSTFLWMWGRSTDTETVRKWRLQGFQHAEPVEHCWKPQKLTNYPVNVRAAHSSHHPETSNFGFCSKDLQRF